MCWHFVIKNGEVDQGLVQRKLGQIWYAGMLMLNKDQ